MNKTFRCRLINLVKIKHLLLMLPILLLCDFGYSQGASQGETLREEAIRVFIDCDFCDIDYIRQNIRYVNYVRDRKVAQVHVMITSQRTGSGGSQYTINLIGQLEFEGQEDSFLAIANQDATTEERRALRTKFLKIGLMKYVANTSMVNFLSIDYVNDEDSLETVFDKWNNWVFKLRANAWFNGQEAYKSKDLYASFSANRITEKWKFENWGSFNYDENEYELDSVTKVFNSNQNYFVESSAIRSINDHWSAGMVMSIRSSTFSNIDFNHRISPALEYNIFNYADFTQKQIRIQYRASYNSFQYVDTTIYNKINERLFNHNLSIAAESKQTWGTVSLSAVASQYIHDPTLKRLSLYGRISWRVVKGLSVNANCNLEFIQDQISLLKGGATDIEILTRQKQLATNFSYWGSFGFSYTFGSIYNNIVNPRFGN